jgi:hypothetical protein
VHFEIDLPDPNRAIPVGTTGEVRIEVGEPVAATEVPLYAATVRGDRATVFVVAHGVAESKTVAVTGEAAGSLFLDPALSPESLVVTEGRALLSNGDRVDSTEASAARPVVERERR